jgi:uncharacterized membrane protein YfcA
MGIPEKGSLLLDPHSDRVNASIRNRCRLYLLVKHPGSQHSSADIELRGFGAGHGSPAIFNCRSKEVQITVLTFSAIIAAGSLGAGLLGSLTGLGGGIVIVPLLTLALGVDIHYAIGASLVSVIATSSGAAAAYAKEGFANIRIGMFLEIAATIGALLGTLITALIAPAAVAVIFGLVLLYSAYQSVGKPPKDSLSDQPDRLARLLQMDGTYPTTDGPRPYHIRSVPGGFAVMLLAGVLSGLLGIGSGALKVIGMDRVMKIPFKVSTATSNFMIGITAAASAGIYLKRGYIDPGIAMPVMLGVLTGSLIGARLLGRARTKTLRLIFALTIALLGIEMIYKGLWGTF